MQISVAKIPVIALSERLNNNVCLEQNGSWCHRYTNFLLLSIVVHRVACFVIFALVPGNCVHRSTWGRHSYYPHGTEFCVPVRQGSLVFYCLVEVNDCEYSLSCTAVESSDENTGR